MGAVRSTVELVQGDQWSIPCTWSGVDITDYTITAEFKWDGGDLEPTVVVTEAASGKFDLRVDELASVDVPAATAIVLNIYAEDEDGNRQTIALRVPVLVTAP